ncbi:uncharacterized protein [Nicotiana tomentosiformis]|uniref:uncharacterized protein n=1 Tax=Nicotiana tomentosiformis TaxID=4098 RepID=UPI00388CA080
MVAPPNFEEGQSTYRPPRFNGQYYGWWKTRMHDFIMAENSELWDVICDGPFLPTKNLGDPAVAIPKTRKEFNDADRKAVEKNFRSKKILVCGIGADEYNRILACQSAKEIWEALQIAHEGTTQVKQSKIDMLTTEYELFRMKDDESIQDMHTRFTSFINELYSIGETIPRNKLVKKILSVLPSSWESKVNDITEVKDLQTLTIDELVGNMKIYEMKKKKDNERREPKREKNLVLKTDNNDSSGEDGDMAYLTKRFQKMVRRNGGIPKRGSSSKPKNYDLCHKCGKPGHFIKECPLLKQDQHKNNFDKATKRNPVPDKCFKRKNVADNVVKQALAVWGDSSSESEEENDHGDSSIMAVESEETKYDSIFALMAQSDDDENDDDDEETIENLKKEKDVLDENIAHIEYDRDDLMVDVVDLKETFECGKEVTSEAHIKLESDLNSVKSSLCAELEKNKQFHEELGRVKSDLDKSLKWTWSSDTITTMYTNNGETGRGLDFKGKRFPTTLIESTLLYLIIGFALTVAILGTLKKTGTVKGRSLQWYMDSDCSKHMTGSWNFESKKQKKKNPNAPLILRSAIYCFTSLVGLFAQYILFQTKTDLQASILHGAFNLNCHELKDDNEQIFTS